MAVRLIGNRALARSCRSGQQQSDRPPRDDSGMNGVAIVGVHQRDGHGVEHGVFEMRAVREQGGRGVDDRVSRAHIHETDASRRVDEQAMGIREPPRDGGVRHLTFGTLVHDRYVVKKNGKATYHGRYEDVI